MQVEWEGSPEYKVVPGAELGARLYAGKKRMFKGHKWERVKAKRKARRRILLRDMDRRVSSYKNVRLAHAFGGFLADMEYSTTSGGDHIRSNLRAQQKHPNCHFRVSHSRTSSKSSNHRVVAASISISAHLSRNFFLLQTTNSRHPLSPSLYQMAAFRSDQIARKPYSVGAHFLHI